MIAFLLALAALFTSAFAQVCKVEQEKWDDRYKIDTRDVNPDWQGMGFTEISNNFYMIPQSHMDWADFPDKCDDLCNSIPICKGWKIHQKFERDGDWHCCHLVSDCEIGRTNSYSSDWTRSCCGSKPPTVAPTMFGQTPTPIADPTAMPTSQPTAEPTAQPTAEPSAQPTAEPSAQPTAEPSAQPTAEPSAQPTAEPSAQPTAEPSAQPTAEPTSQPTGQPTAEPTSQPTVRPTAQPTPEPTRQPTQEPAEIPTNYPTHLPTLDPTPTPTRLPTANPTAQPTRQPTPQPTRPPRTPEPSFPWPTRSPTLAPTVFGETMRPTSVPTVAPTQSPFADTLIQPVPEDDSSPFFTKPEFWGPLLLLLLALLAWIWWKFCRAKKPERMSQQPLNLGFKSDFNTFQAEDPELTIGQGSMGFEPLPAPPVVVEPGVMSDDESMASRQVSMPSLPPPKIERDATLKWRVKM